MPKTIIENVLSGKLPLDIVLKWLNTDSDEETPEDCELFCCSRSEFVAYFIAYLRIQTDSLLKPKGLNQNQTPEKLTQRSHKRSTSEPTTQQDTETPLKTERHRSHESPNRDKNHSHIKKPGRRVKTKLFMNDSKEYTNQSFSTSKTDSDDSKISSNSLENAVSSTPLKNGINISDYPNLNVTSPVTPQGSGRQSFSYERCDTPRIGHRYKTQDKSVSLGDYIVNAHLGKTSAQKKKRQSKNDSATDGVLNLSSSEFPKIGDKKSADKRRIKPTNIDRTTPKSFTMNSFNSEQFQQPSHMASADNFAFRHQNMQPKELAKSFDVERSILKQERHKLMEKFNILNVGTTPKVSTSQSKITQKISTDKQPNYVRADLNKVLYKNEIDSLTNIYNVMIVNNLILSVGCELFFLINILLSKQTEDDYVQIERMLLAKQNQTNKDESEITKNNVEKNILKSIHNSVYFAVKSLWHLRNILDVIFDKNTLKLLGENKDVRGFLPELAKYLLNAYGLKCELDNAMSQTRQEKESTLLDRAANGMVCFNVETDNVENFPSVLSFQNFRKQRDMFYEILRWYNETQQTGPAKSTFRSRVKTILSVCVCAANYAHLARLYVAHMVAECLPHRREESKLSKLQRRLTGATVESRRLPFFTEKEMFYKEFLLFAEQEAFRAHLRDCLTSEICLLDSTALTNIDESTQDIAKEYLYTAKKLQLLSKFLGFLSDLPYTQVPIDYNLKTGHCDYSLRDIIYSMPKENILLNEVAIRNYNQPTINLKDILTEATEKERLCISLPWITQYLATLHHATLRIHYYKEILNILFEIYTERLKENSENIKKSIRILLKFQLGWLFNLPQFPQEQFFEFRKKINKMAAGSVDLTDASDGLRLDSVLGIDESMILELCPFLKDVSSLLSSTRPIVESKECSYRHITPLSLTLNNVEKIRNKEREIQLRLEEALIKSSPASTRRVLEVVIERVSASTLRALATLLRDARDGRADMLLKLPVTLNKSDLHSALTQLYTAQLESLRKEGLAVAQKRICGAVKGALGALLTLSPKQAEPLEAIAVRHCKENVAKWIHNNWTGIEILCKDINEEIRNIVSLGCSYIQGVTPTAGVNVSALLADGSRFEESNVSPSLTVIVLKEYICILLDDEQPTIDIYKVLSDCVLACAPTNVFALPGLHSVVCQLVCDLCVVLASQNPKQINDKFLNKIYDIFNLCCPERHKTDSTQQTIDKSTDLNNTTDLSINKDNSNSLEIDHRDFERDFNNDDRMPTPISDDEDNSSKTVMRYEMTAVTIDKNDSLQNLQSKSVVTKINDKLMGKLPDNSLVIDNNSEISSLICEPSTSKTVDKNVDHQNCHLSNNLLVDLNKLNLQNEDVMSIADTKNMQLDTNMTDFDSKTSDLHSEIADYRGNKEIVRNNTEFDTKKTESDTKTPESDTKTPETDTKTPESDTKTPETDTKTTNLDLKRTLNESTRIEDSEITLDYFNRMLCARNIVILSKSRNKQTEVWEAMADILIFLLKYGFLNEESLTEQCLAAYRQDWPENVLVSLSTCMRLVSTKWRTRLGGKFNLFLDFLSEYCNTMDFDSFEIN